VADERNVRFCRMAAGGPGVDWKVENNGIIKRARENL
jgi:hypothetical protein